MLSGGSSLALLNFIDTTIIHENATITVLDERHSKDENECNFSQIMATGFYGKARGSGAKFIDIRMKNNESLEDHGERFDRELKNWRVHNPSAPIIATIGIGSDGHVAGMMPYPHDKSLFFKHFQGHRWAVGYNAGAKNLLPLRVTVTIPFLRDQVFFAVSFVSGAEKKDTLKRASANEGILADTPARILCEMKDVNIFTNIKL